MSEAQIHIRTHRSEKTHEIWGAMRTEQEYELNL